MKQSIDYRGIYAELVPLIGEEAVRQIYEHYGGQQVTFPNRLYSSEYIKQYIELYYTGANHKEIARQFGYSERWMKRLIADYLEETGKN